MKQKMCIKLPTNRDNLMKKAMKVVSGANGVIHSMVVEGECMDKLVVVTEGVDAVCLLCALRKKACYATIETCTIEEVRSQVAVNQHSSIAQTPSVNYDQPRSEVHRVVDDSYDPTCCLTM